MYTPPVLDLEAVLHLPTLTVVSRLSITPDRVLRDVRAVNRNVAWNQATDCRIGRTQYDTFRRCFHSPALNQVWARTTPDEDSLCVVVGGIGALNTSNIAIKNCHVRAIPVGSAYTSNRIICALDYAAVQYNMMWQSSQRAHRVIAHVIERIGVIRRAIASLNDVVREVIRCKVYTYKTIVIRAIPSEEVRLRITAQVSICNRRHDAGIS